MARLAQKNTDSSPDDTSSVIEGQDPVPAPQQLSESDDGGEMSELVNSLQQQLEEAAGREQDYADQIADLHSKLEAQTKPDQTAANPASTQGQATYVEMVVLDHGYDYRRLDPNDSTRTLEQRLALRGETVLLNQAQADKGQLDGALGTQDDLDARIGRESQPLPDETIIDLDVVDVLAYLSNHQSDDELNRIETLERYRGDDTRSAVLDFIQKIRDAKTEQ